MPATAAPQLSIDRSHSPVRVIVCDISAAIAEAGTDKPLPESLVVMKWGENQTAKGRVVVNDTTLRVLPAIHKASNLDRIALDFEHNTVPGHPSYKGEPAKIAAMGALGVESGKGLVLSGLDYTPEGTEFIRGKHYQDLSPVVVLNARDEVVAVTSVAACRAGATPDLGITLSADLFIKSNPMKFDQLILTALGLAALPPGIAATRETCLSLFGLKPDASDAEIEAAAAAIKPAQAAPDAQVKELTTTVQTLTAQVKALADKADAQERTLILDAAVAEGKVVPKELIEGEGALDNAKLKALVATLPITVPLDRRTGPAATPSSVTLSSTTDEVVRQTLGISEEDWKKHNR